MQNKKIITNLVFLIVLFASAATVAGIFSTGGVASMNTDRFGAKPLQSCDGLYQACHRVTIQGIAQDCDFSSPFPFCWLHCTASEFNRLPVSSPGWRTKLLFCNLSFYDMPCIMCSWFIALTGFSFLPFSRCCQLRTSFSYLQ